MDADSIDAARVRQDNLAELSGECLKLVRGFNKVFELAMRSLTPEQMERLISALVGPATEPESTAIPLTGGGDIQWWATKLRRSESAVRRMFKRINMPSTRTGEGRHAKLFYSCEAFWTLTSGESSE